jgi:type VI secretion system ImpM family protein
MAGTGRAHLVGKLPSLPEYVGQLGEDDPERTFGDMLDSAAGYAAHEGGSRWCAAYDGAGALGFVFRPSPNARSVLLGAVVPSQDSVGRRYPLMAVTVFDGDAIAYLPAAASSFVGRLGAALSGARATARADVAAQPLAQIAAPEQADVRHAADDFARWIEEPGLLPKIWKALFPQGRAEDALRAMFAASQLGALTQKSDDGGTRYLRCPLGRGGAAAASFWLSVFVRAAGGEQMISSAFWSLEGEGTLFVVFARQPSIDFWLRLWTHDQRDMIEAASIERSDPNEALARAVRSKDARIKDVLESLGS